jgi:alkylhydroperoxidase family enzyme
MVDDGPMRASYEKFLDKLREQLLTPKASLPLDVRRDILDGRIVEGALNAFIVRVRGSASSITQAHIDQVKAAGFDEDAIFEAAICAALVAGTERYHAAIKAISEAGDAT